METVIDSLEARGLIEAMTSEEVRSLCQKPLTVYCGFDPTAESLHLGNLISIMGLARFQRFGHTPIVIIGGATGMIGDPSGKSHERPLLTHDQLEKNQAGIRRDLEKILDFNHPTAPAILLNNYDWFEEINLIHFLRDIGKHFRIGPMLAKESVRSRLSSEEGMSFTEFSYQLLQAYDFLHLYREYNTTLQIGGSDQWGNITAGKELIRRVTNGVAHGLTFPLLLTSDGKKFGKSEEGAIWLAADRCSPYDFYQYLLRTADADVIRLMQMLTFMEAKEIADWAKQMEMPGYLPNSAQRHLAQEVTRIVHGQKGLEDAERITAAAAPGAKTALDVAKLAQLAEELPCHTMEREQLNEMELIDLLTTMGMTKSKSEGRRLVRNGGVYLNNEQISEEGRRLTAADYIGDCFLLISIGKKRKALVRIAPEAEYP